jgi:hypothetical protein
MYNMIINGMEATTFPYTRRDIVNATFESLMKPFMHIYALSLAVEVFA